MKWDINNLPHDPRLLHRLVKDLVGTIESQQHQIENNTNEIEVKSKQLKAQTRTIAQLQRRLDELNRHRFGRRSQKIDPAQLTLWQQSLDEDIAETEQALGHAAPQKPSAQRAKRKPLPVHLPREKKVYESAEGRCSCGHALHPIGVQTSEELHWKPATFYVVRHEQTKYACRQCDSVTTAAKPSRPIEKGLLGSSLLAYLLVSKYQDHIPVDRLRRICQRSHIDLPTSTLTDALGRCGAILRPLVERQIAWLQKSTHLHTDDTVIPVLDAEAGQTKQGRLWVYVHTGTDGPPMVVFDYTPTRRQQGPFEFLKDFRGYLQADGYPGYESLYRRGDIQEVACWAHVRAKFEKLEKRLQSPIAQQALVLIGQLYAIERSIKSLSYEDRKQQREQHATPVLQSLRKHFEKNLLAVGGNSDIADPINYALHRWDALVRYTTDGRLNIDNNPAERCIRPITIGRKNWVFAGTDLAAERTAIIYSLIETCKLHDVDPYTYFKDVLERIADHPNKQLDDLLPFNWKPAQKPD